MMDEDFGKEKNLEQGKGVSKWEEEEESGQLQLNRNQWGDELTLPLQTCG